MKTALTKEIEQSLIFATRANEPGIYGALEVTLGEGYGTERIDYMTMDTKNIFRCYEIKISKKDFYSKAKLSFAGDYNYLVLAQDVYNEVKQDIDIKFYGIGVYVYNGYDLILKKRAKQKTVHIGQKIDLMYCMIWSFSRYTIMEALKSG